MIIIWCPDWHGFAGVQSENERYENSNRGHRGVSYFISSKILSAVQNAKTDGNAKGN